MGIRGLSTWIRWATPESAALPVWESLRGKRVGVDILGLLYKAKAQRIPLVKYLSQFMVRCRMYGIVPIPIFDGKPPDEKRPMLARRAERRIEASTRHAKLFADATSVPIPDGRRVIIEEELQRLEFTANFLTSDERDEAKQFFYACGAMSYNASGEADNILAYLARRGMVDAVISNDFDMLARGVPQLLVPETYALPGDTSGWRSYNLQSIIKAVEFTYDQFLEMCVLMGCDYLTGVLILPYKTAYWAIKYRGDMYKTLAAYKVTNIVPYAKAKSILVGNEETLDSLMGEKQWEKWAKAETEPLKAEPETIHRLQETILHLPPQELKLLLEVA